MAAVGVVVGVVVMVLPCHCRWFHGFEAVTCERTVNTCDAEKAPAYFYS